MLYLNTIFACCAHKLHEAEYKIAGIPNAGQNIHSKRSVLIWPFIDNAYRSKGRSGLCRTFSKHSVVTSTFQYPEKIVCTSARYISFINKSNIEVCP